MRMTPQQEITEMLTDVRRIAERIGELQQDTPNGEAMHSSNIAFMAAIRVRDGLEQWHKALPATPAQRGSEEVINPIPGKFISEIELEIEDGGEGTDFYKYVGDHDDPPITTSAGSGEPQ